MMSFFYLTPVKGDLPVHILEVILLQRLEYLKELLNGNSVVYSEYLVEGSVYDNVGHFMLCIISILGENTSFTQFFYKAELELFIRRLASLSAYDMRCFAKKLLRTIKKYEQVPKFIYPLQVLCQHLMLKDLAQHICATHSNECTAHSLGLNFRYCLSFVAKRLVELRNGVATIPCGRWKQYLCMLFTENLKYRMNNKSLDPLKSDPRINELLNKVKSEFSMCKDTTSILKSQDVDNISRFFPPCMLNLHLSLRNKHRLLHTQRFHYSLFLKDIGMPINEAVDFWRTEYRHAPNGSHSCCHTWERDEKKYLYGIRHMYGLEGCRKNYASVNCHSIQSADKACSEGGCPFKSFDNDKMISLLSNCSDSLLSKINVLKSKNLYTSACMLFLQKNDVDPFRTHCDNYSFNFTPVKYFMVASKEKEMK